MNKKFNLTSLIATVVIFSATSFYLGMAYQKTKIPAPGTNREAMREAMGRGDFANPENLDGRGVRGGQIIGKIIKINDNSLTVELNDGGSNTIYITEETFIGQMEKIDQNILQEGQEVLIFGENQEGQGVIAESIQIR